MGAKRVCALLAVLCAVAAAAGGARTAPLTVHLVIDSSQSMRGSKASYTRAAVQTVVALVPEGTRVAIVGFGQEAKDETAGYVTIGGNRDRERLRDIVAGIAFNGQRTNYLDPLKLVEPRVLAGGGATLVIFLSDGADNVNTGRRGWRRVLDTAKAIHVSGARLETIFLESKGGIGSLFSSAKRNRQRMVEMAGGGGKFHPIVGKPVQIVDVLLEILGDLANYARVDVDEQFGRRPDATISQLVLLGFPPRRARAIQLVRDGAPADLNAYSVYPYPAPKDAAQGTTDRYSLIKVFSIPRPGGHAWSLRPGRRPAEWEARALERRGVFFEFATGAPKPAYDLPRETVRAIIEVSGPGAPKPEALLKALPGLDGQLAVTSQTGAQQEDWKALASSRWLRLVPEIRDARLLLVPETAEKDGRLPENETRRLIALTRQAKDANYTCVARIRFGHEGQRGEVVKQKSFKVQVTLGVSASPDPLDLGLVSPGSAAGPKTLSVSCNWRKPVQVTARIEGLVCREGGQAATIPAGQITVAPAAFRLPGTRQLEVGLRCPADAQAGLYEGTLRFAEAGAGHGLGSCRIRAVVAAVLTAPKQIVLKGNAGGDATLDPQARPVVATNSAAAIPVALEVTGKLPGRLVAKLVPEKASRCKPARLAVTLRSIPPATKPGVYEAAATAKATVARPEGGTYVVKSAPIAIRAELSGCELAAKPALLRLGPTVAGDRTKPARLTVQTNATVALTVQCKPSDLTGPNGARIPASRLGFAWERLPTAKKGAPAMAGVSLDLRHPREGETVRPFPSGNYAAKLSLTAEGAATQVQVTASVLSITLEAAPPALAFPAALARGKTVPLKLAVSTNTPDPLPLKLAAGDLTAEAGAKLAAKRIRIAWATPREVSRGKPARLEMVVDLSPTVTRRPDKEPIIRAVAEGTYKGKLSLSAPGCATRQVAVTVAVRPISIQADPQALVFEPGLAGGETNAVRLTVHTNSPADLPIKHAAGGLLGKDGARIPADRVRVEWDGKPVAKHGTPAAAKVFVNLRHTTVRRREAAPVIRRFPPGEYAGSLTLSAPGCGDVRVALEVTIETTWLRAAPAQLAFAPTSVGRTTPPLRLTVSTNSPAGVSFALAPSDLVGKGKTIPAKRVQVAWDAEAVTRKVKPAVATLTVDLGHETVTTPERGRVVRQIPRGEYRGRLTVSAEGFEPQTVPVSVKVVSVTLGAKPSAVAIRAKAGGDAVRAPPMVLTTNAPGAIEVTLGEPRDAWLAAAPGKEHKAVERLPFAIAMEPAAVRFSAKTPQSGRTVRLVIGDVWPGAGGTYGCKVDAVARGLSATIDVTVTVEPIRLWLKPAELDLGKAVAGGTSGVGEVRVLTDSQQPVSVAVSVRGAVKEAAGRPTLALLDKPLAVSAKAPGTVSMRASAPRGAQAGQHRFAVTCRATEWEGTQAQATALARVAQPAYDVEPRLVDFGTGLTGSTLRPRRLTLSSDIVAPEKASLTCSPFSFERGGKRVTLVGARVAATQSAGEVVAGKPVVFELRLSVPRNYRKLPEREPVYDVVAEGTYAAEAAIEVGGQVRHRVPLRVTVKRRPRK